jgi:SAM-dependent methyltransferase
MMNPHIRLFHRIAPIYNRFGAMQRRMFAPAVAEHRDAIGAEPGDSFLDVGCGTGVLLAVLREAGFRAEGVDAAPNMVREGQKAGQTCALGDIGAGLPFPDSSFDFVISSFVAHGLDAGLRRGLYREAGRIARKAVIIHDYRGRQGPLTEIVEWFEGGDFFNFAESAEAEMREAFGELEVIDLARSKAWYVGRNGAARS